MNRCPITYEPCGEDKYSRKGLKRFSPRMEKFEDLNYTQEELLRESAIRSVKLSVQGMQPKLSARINIEKGKFEIVDRFATYIIKPQNPSYPELPENEDLTMKLASTVGIEVPFHGMVYTKDGRLAYFIKRFDRYGKSKKHAIEDFAQLAGKTRDTKYEYSMEKLTGLIDKYCTFPAIEKVKLFRVTLFNYLTGNEDMHLKNFSLITVAGKTELSPAYDLLNTTIAISNPQEEIALPLRGKKSKLNYKDLVEYWGKERLELTDKVIQNEIGKYKSATTSWTEMIHDSFLSNSMKDRYTNLLEKRTKQLFSN